MVSYRYDKRGHLTGFTKSSLDVANQRLINILLFILALFLASLAPIAAVGFFTFKWVENQTHIHPLFAGIVAAIPILILLSFLWKSRIFRYIYFGIESFGVAAGSYFIASHKTDYIWSGFIALISLVICLFVKYLLANAGFGDQDTNF